LKFKTQSQAASTKQKLKYTIVSTFVCYNNNIGAYF